MKIYFASGNSHKREEMARIFQPHSIVLPSDEGISFNPEETENSFFGNSLLKARALWEIVQKPVLADDSGICVDALNGAPGIYSARFGSENGIELSSGQRNELLLSRMKGITNRTSRFVCSMVLYLGKDRFINVQETLEGVLIDRELGTGGFGYDPVLFVPSYNKTVAQMTAEEKDACSHRGKAGRLLVRLLTDDIT